LTYIKPALNETVAVTQAEFHHSDSLSDFLYGFLRTEKTAATAAMAEFRED